MFVSTNCQLVLGFKGRGHRSVNVATLYHHRLWPIMTDKHFSFSFPLIGLKYVDDIYQYSENETS
jgi:hypothetical protein